MARRIETKRSWQAKDFHGTCGLDTPLGLHSGLLDHRTWRENKQVPEKHLSVLLQVISKMSP
jgi:hypothetical protein